MNIYVVTMYRYGDREKHSYVLGVYSKSDSAISCGELEELWRGDKYESEVLEFPLDYCGDLGGDSYRIVKGLKTQ